MIKITPNESYYKVSIAEITETMEIVINTGYDVKPKRNIGCGGLGRITAEELKIEEELEKLKKRK